MVEAKKKEGKGNGGDKGEEEWKGKQSRDGGDRQTDRRRPWRPW